MFLYDEKSSTRDAEKTSKNVAEERSNFDRFEVRSSPSVGENFRPASMNNHSVDSIVNGASRKRKMSENLFETEKCSKEKNLKVFERGRTDEVEVKVNKR